MENIPPKVLSPIERLVLPRGICIICCEPLTLLDTDHSVCELCWEETFACEVCGDYSGDCEHIE